MRCLPSLLLCIPLAGCYDFAALGRGPADLGDLDAASGPCSPPPGDELGGAGAYGAGLEEWAIYGGGSLAAGEKDCPGNPFHPARLCAMPAGTDVSLAGDDRFVAALQPKTTYRAYARVAVSNPGVLAAAVGLRFADTAGMPFTREGDASSNATSDWQIIDSGLLLSPTAPAHVQVGLSFHRRDGSAFPGPTCILVDRIWAVRE